MDPRKAVLSDPEPVRNLEALVGEAWNSLSPDRRQRTTKCHLARRIMKRAAQGIRDPARLRAYAVLHVVPRR
jgi:hypothetical protein